MVSRHLRIASGDPAVGLYQFIGARTSLTSPAFTRATVARDGPATETLMCSSFVVAALHAAICSTTGQRSLCLNRHIEPPKGDIIGGDPATLYTGDGFH